VIFAGQLAVGALDLILLGIPGESHYLVVVFVFHGFLSLFESGIKAKFVV
jgi:hypothetical protein